MYSKQKMVVLCIVWLVCLLPFLIPKNHSNKIQLQASAINCVPNVHPRKGSTDVFFTISVHLLLNPQIMKREYCLLLCHFCLYWVDTVVSLLNPQNSTLTLARHCQSPPHSCVSYNIFAIRVLLDPQIL